MGDNKIVPLSSGFMLTSILGIIISIFYIFQRYPKWGFTFVLFFILTFIASLISMTYAPAQPDY